MTEIGLGVSVSVGVGVGGGGDNNIIHRDFSSSSMFFMLLFLLLLIMGRGPGVAILSVAAEKALDQGGGSRTHALYDCDTPGKREKRMRKRSEEVKK